MSFSQIQTKKHGVDVYYYFKRKDIDPDVLERLDGLTWEEASNVLNTSIPGLFIFLEKLIRLGVIEEVEIV